MTVRKRNVIENSLGRKGFTLRVDGDHRFLDFEPHGNRHFFTKVSHGANDIGDVLLAKMSRQCHLSKAEFLNLVDCPMTQDEYENCLKGKGVLS